MRAFPHRSGQRLVFGKPTIASCPFSPHGGTAGALAESDALWHRLETPGIFESACRN
jgi:hypothetical protein